MMSNSPLLGSQVRHSGAMPIATLRFIHPATVRPSVGELHHLGGGARRRHSHLCRTQDKEGASSSSANFNSIGANGSFYISNNIQKGGPPRSSKHGASETYQQLRQAVLSSLDFSENAEATQDWDDWDESSEEAVADLQTPAIGKAVFECMRVDTQGKTRSTSLRRRDLIKRYKLQPRDLRRIDPSMSPTKTSPSVSSKEDCVLVNIGGVRAIITADKCSIFEPSSVSSKRFINAVMRKIEDAAATEPRRSQGMFKQQQTLDSGSQSMDGYSSTGDAYADSGGRRAPFELDILECALSVATERLELELGAASRRSAAVHQKLPREIIPKNLEELRQVKQMLVELESKAENLRDMLTELMDDEDELLDLNLSSRPKREEKRRQREREYLEREMEREREVSIERGMRIIDGLPATTAATAPPLPTPMPSSLPGAGVATSDAAMAPPPPPPPAPPAPLYNIRLENDEDDGAGPQTQDAGARLEEIADKEEEDRELEEVEDLLESYVQRASTTQSIAERLLAGARDLEESIGVQLSYRRFEVNKLELMLSIASFSAALGAMVASIFGMNLRSTLEMSVIGFWSTTMAIVAGSCWVFWLLYKYTQSKRIL